MAIFHQILKRFSLKILASFLYYSIALSVSFITSGLLYDCIEKVNDKIIPINRLHYVGPRPINLIVKEPQVDSF